MPRGHRLQVPVETQVQCVLEGLAGTPVEELCRRYGLSQSQYYRLRDRFLEGGKAGLLGNGRDAERVQHESRIAEMERVVGRLTVENQALKKTLH
jgi:transposase-like protein